jgi:oxygen-independent coproporphyrinogen-3 oxidase
MLEVLRAGGFTRISFGVQSLAPHVLRMLDRTHTPGRALEAIAEARAAGFDRVSADLIYATPGETDDDLRASLRSVLGAGVDHLSAYSLIVEDGTRLAARVKRGEMPPVDDDIAAARYAIVDEEAAAAGLEWYEISNWSLPGAECRHNLGYWANADWWGAGPGAHGHLAGRRWWNVKHPATYAEAIAAGRSPAAGEETVDAAARALEDVMLGVRTRYGLPVADLEAEAVGELQGSGLVEVLADVIGVDGPRAVLTPRGRLLADAVARRLTG